MLILQACGQDVQLNTPMPKKQSVIRLPQSPEMDGEPTATNTSVYRTMKTSTPLPTSTTIPNDVKAFVLQVHDVERIQVVLEGDHMQDSHTVQLIGVQAPSKLSDFSWEKIANETLTAWIQGKVVRLLQDDNMKNIHGELPRYVYLEGTLINKILLELGLGRVAEMESDNRFEADFRMAEKTARDKKLGLWGPLATPTITPMSTPTITATISSITYTIVTTSPITSNIIITKTNE